MSADTPPLGRRPAIGLLIVDDHPVVRDGLTGMFTDDPEFEVLGQAADGHEAVPLTAFGGNPVARSAGTRRRCH